VRTSSMFGVRQQGANKPMATSSVADSAGVGAVAAQQLSGFAQTALTPPAWLLVDHGPRQLRVSAHSRRQ
jgi:hypothetical protein